jgi:uncharacterized membrane protein
MKARKCKYCKSTFEPIAFLQKNCFDPNCVTEWINETKQKEWKKKKAKLKLDLMTKSDYMKLTQIVFNKYIRIRDKNKDCISCGAKAGTYTLTAGHYFPSTNKSVTFNEDNLHGQCWFNCNSSKSGNLAEYRIGLIERIGVERLEQLEAESRKTRKFNIEELKEIIKIYKSKCKEFENKY